MKVWKSALTFGLVFALSVTPSAYGRSEDARTKPSHPAEVTVTPLLKTTSSWDGKPIVYPKGQAEVTGLLLEIAPGAETGWHEHTVPSFAIVLEGILEVTLKNGEVKRLQSGDALAEVVDTLHNGRSIGTKPVKIAVFYAGVVGKPLTIKHPEMDGATTK